MACGGHLKHNRETKKHPSKRLSQTSEIFPRSEFTSSRNFGDTQVWAPAQFSERILGKPKGERDILLSYAAQPKSFKFCICGKNRTTEGENEPPQEN